MLKRFNKYYQYLKYHFYKLLSKKRKNWRSLGSDSTMKGKRYSSYEDYVQHQKSKLNMIKDLKMVEYEKNYFENLLARLKDKNIQHGSRVLCLAARLGAEVRAFGELGCFAVGIDLNPGDDNKYVLYGDFHSLQFPDDSIDIVFSNSFDHVFDLQKVLSEIKRVLIPEGTLILEIVKGSDEGVNSGYWESLAWSKIDDLVNEIEKEGFKVLSREEFDLPWVGENVVLQSH